MAPVARALRPTSGPKVARLFGATLAVLWVVAWWSWAVQWPTLLGDHGILPLRETLARPGAGTALGAPSLFWLDASGSTQGLVLGVGLVAAAVAASGFVLRPLLAACVVCYGSFVTVGAPFFPLLGDRLLLEATLLALLIPRNRTSTLLHLLARLMLVRLYVTAGWAHIESLSHLGELWRTGSLGHLLERGPLPTWGGFVLAQLPQSVLSALGVALVLIELGVPWLLLGPRPLRLVAGLVLTAVQLVGLLLFNLGLTAFVLTALHLFALGEGDVDLLVRDVTPQSGAIGRALVHLTRPRSRPLSAATVRLLWPWRAVRLALVVCYLVASAQALAPLNASLASGAAGLPHLPVAWQPALAPAEAGQDAGARIEALFEVLPAPGEPHDTPRGGEADSAWQPLGLWHQPADVFATPQLIAPHAPRLDLALSAFGEQAAQGGEPPPIVHGLVRMLCHHPARLGRLVRPHRWRHAQAVRFRLYRYVFAPLREHKRSGAYWLRRAVGSGTTWRCDGEPDVPS